MHLKRTTLTMCGPARDRARRGGGAPTLPALSQRAELSPLHIQRKGSATIRNATETYASERKSKHRCRCAEGRL